MPTLRNIQKRNKRNKENIHKTMDLSFNFIRPDFETKFKKNITNLFSLSMYTLLNNKYRINILTCEIPQNLDHCCFSDIYSSFNLLLIKINNITDFDVYKLANVKYNFYNDIINKKLFLCNKMSNDVILNIFNECQTLYFKLTHLKKKIVHKISKVFDFDEDLRSNKLKDINRDNLIEMIDNKTIYTFRISDLVNIIENSLCSCEYEMVQNPLLPKNPFTNNVLNNSFLINLYFKVKHSNLKMPILFHHFFLCYFNLFIFEVENDVLIREQVIIRYIKNLTEDEYYNNIMKMLRIVKRKYKLNIVDNIDKKTPKHFIVNALKNYYHCFLNSERSINNYKSSIFLIRFKKSIFAFHRYNKIFGRLIFVTGGNSKPSYITHHLEFNKVNKFLKEQEMLDCYEPDIVMDNRDVGIPLPNIPTFTPRNVINEIINNNPTLINDDDDDDNDNDNVSYSSTNTSEYESNYGNGNIIYPDINDNVEYDDTEEDWEGDSDDNGDDNGVDNST